MTHYVMVRIEAHVGTTQRALVEEIASNLESVKAEDGIVSGVVMAVSDSVEHHTWFSKMAGLFPENVATF